MNVFERERGVTAGEKLWLKELGKVKRFVFKEECLKNLEMIHRSDDFIHVRRVMYLGRYLVKIIEQDPFFVYKPDMRKVSDMAYHHDDSEIVTADVLATEKNRMRGNELQNLERKEDLAAYAVAHFIFGLEHPFDQVYVDRQREQKNKITLESQIVNVADKWDAVCEILHEVRCGNKPFSQLLTLSKQTFNSFVAKYAFYAVIQENPLLEFNKIPTPEQAVELSTISIDDLEKPTDVVKFMSFEKTQGWPACYRTWADLNKTIFDIRPEKFIFPGWYMQLWIKWKTFPGKTTASGLWVR